MKNKIFLAVVMSIFISGCMITNNEPIEPVTVLKNELVKPKKDRITATDNIRVPNSFFLNDSSWYLIKYNNKDVSKNISLTMNFKKGFDKKYDLMVSGKSSCNSYSIDIMIDTNNHKFISNNSSLISTKKYCKEPTIRNLEIKFINMMLNNQKIEKYNNDILYMVDNENNSFEFSKL